MLSVIFVKLPVTMIIGGGTAFFSITDRETQKLTNVGGGGGDFSEQYLNSLRSQGRFRI